MGDIATIPLFTMPSSNFSVNIFPVSRSQNDNLIALQADIGDAGYLLTCFSKSHVGLWGTLVTLLTYFCLVEISCVIYQKHWQVNQTFLSGHQVYRSRWCIWSIGSFHLFCLFCLFLGYASFQSSVLKTL